MGEKGWLLPPQHEACGFGTDQLFDFLELDQRGGWSTSVGLRMEAINGTIVCCACKPTFCSTTPDATLKGLPYPYSMMQQARD